MSATSTFNVDHQITTLNIISESTTALVVEGGAVFGGDVTMGENLSIDGSLYIESTTNIVPVMTGNLEVGSFITLGGAGVTKDLYVGGNLTANSIFGNIIGDITGNVTGDVTGNVWGTHTGPVFGDVTGNLTGTVTGDVTGNVWGTHTGPVIGDVTGNLTGTVTGDVTGNVWGQLTGCVVGTVTGDVTGNLTGDVTGNIWGQLTGCVVGTVTGDVTGNITGYVFDTSNNQVVGTRQTAPTATGTMVTIGSNTGTPGAGLSLIGDTSAGDQSGPLMNDLAALQANVDALATTLNDLLTALSNHGLIL